MRSPLPPDRRQLVAFLAATWCALSVLPALPAQTAPAAGAAPPPGPQPAAPSAMVNLINRLVERGALTRQDSAELVAQANADAADERVRAAETLLAAAKADAAVARAQAAAAQAQYAASQAAQLAMAQQNAARALLGQPVNPPVAAAAPAPAAPNAAQPEAPAPGAPAMQAPAVPYATQPYAQAPAPQAAPPPYAQQPYQQPAPQPAPPEVAQAAPSLPPAQSPVALAPFAVSPTAPVSPPAAPPTTAPLTAENLPAPGGSSVPTTTVPSSPEGDGIPTTVVPMDASQAPVTTTVPPPANPAATPAPAAPSENPGATGVVVPPAAAAEAGAVSAAESAAAGVGSSAPSPALPGIPTPAAPTASSAEQPVAAGDLPNGSVRVAYVPQVVKNEIREEVKNEVLAEEKARNWAGARTLPAWIQRVTLFGDLRVREEGIINHGANDTAPGLFPNLNALDTSATPFFLGGNVPAPQLDVNQNRNRTRLRARIGAAVDLSSGFTMAVRAGTGNDNNPVTENQTLGGVGPTGQGGNFGKYAIWLDRAYLRYQTGGDPTRDLSITLGRFDNPFFSTTMLWASDLGFDGAAVVLPAKVHLRGEVLDSFRPFFVAGAFPIYNTDLNFASTDAVKLKSYDKWLAAGQFGFDWRAGSDVNLKLAAALYEFKNVEGQLSTPGAFSLATDIGSTDISRPSFAQNGNSYMPLRAIIPGPLNDNGLNVYQYFGLATPFHDLAFTGRFDYNHFDPYQLSLTGEYVRNVAFDRQNLQARAVAGTLFNNLDAKGNYFGGNVGWLANVRFGKAVLQNGGDWALNLGYRRVESDAVIDGFTDSDFGGPLAGTNLKGLTVSGSVALAPGVWIDLRWMSANAISGYNYKNDLLQLDVNGKF